MHSSSTSIHQRTTADPQLGGQMDCRACRAVTASSSGKKRHQHAPWTALDGGPSWVRRYVARPRCSTGYEESQQPLDHLDELVGRVGGNVVELPRPRSDDPARGRDVLPPAATDGVGLTG